MFSSQSLPSSTHSWAALFPHPGSVSVWLMVKQRWRRMLGGITIGLVANPKPICHRVASWQQQLSPSGWGCGTSEDGEVDTNLRHMVSLRAAGILDGSGSWAPGWAGGFLSTAGSAAPGTSGAAKPPGSSLAQLVVAARWCGQEWKGELHGLSKAQQPADSSLSGWGDRVRVLANWVLCRAGMGSGLLVTYPELRWPGAHQLCLEN